MGKFNQSGLGFELETSPGATLAGGEGGWEGAMPTWFMMEEVKEWETHKHIHTCTHTHTHIQTSHHAPTLAWGSEVSSGRLCELCRFMCGWRGCVRVHWV